MGEAGELAPHGAPATVAIDSGCWWHGEAGKPVGKHRGGVGARFEGSGEDEGLTGIALPMAARSGGGGSPVRGHRRGRGRSLHGRRGAPGRGGARGGEGEAVPWPEVPVGVEALVSGNGGAEESRGGRAEREEAKHGCFSVTVAARGKGTRRRGRMCDAWRRRGGRWRGGVAVRGDRGDQATHALG
jgi:hypothetical protein